MSIAGWRRYLPARTGFLLLFLAAVLSPGGVVRAEDRDGRSGARIEPGDFEASGVELLAHLPRSAFAGTPFATDIWGYVSPSGREYAIVGFTNLTAFVEITNPRSPVIIAEISNNAASATHSDMAVYQNYCYTVTENDGNGIRIFDMDRIDEGTVFDVGTVNPGSFRTAHNIWVNAESGYAYAVGANIDGGGLTVFDLSNPRIPTRVGSFQGTWGSSRPAYIHDVEVVSYTGGPYAGREIAFCSTERTGFLAIVDVTNKSAMFERARITYPNASVAHQTSLTEDRRHILLGDEGDEVFNGVASTTTHVFNVENLDTPVYAGSFNNGNPSSDHNQFVRGSFTFQANYRSGLRVYDITALQLDDVGGVEEIGYLDTFPGSDTAGFSGAWGVFVDFPSEIVVVSDIDNGFFVIDPFVARDRSFTDVTDEVLGDPAESHGAAWVDVDRDSHVDLYVSGSGPNRLYFNEGGGSFLELTEPPLNDVRNGRTAIWADIDGDEDADVYVVNASGPNALLRNDEKFFTDITGVLGDGGNGRGAGWADYDGDGRIDLYLANFGHPNRLFRNLGNGEFEDLTEAAGVTDGGNSAGVAWADHDGDGDPDLFVATYGGPNRLFRNEGSGTFVDVAAGPVLRGEGARTVGAAWGDVDNDGDLDIYLTGDGDPNVLLRNDGADTFVDITEEAGPIGSDGPSAGVAWADYDLDGWIDLFMTEIGGGVRLFRNQPGSVFLNRTGANFVNTGTPLGIALGDYDDDGDLDLFTPNTEGTNHLFRNDADTALHWLMVRLKGVVSNPDGIGARVRIVTGGQAQLRQIEAGSGYLSQHSILAHFGLGGTTSVDSLRVYWPSGAVFDTTDVSVDQTLVLVERDATPVLPPQAVPGPTPRAFELYAAAPDPFNPSTRIHYDVAVPGRVDVSILDVGGRRVRRLVDAHHPAGRYRVVWDGRDDSGRAVASGTYFYRLSGGRYSSTRRVTLLR